MTELLQWDEQLFHLINTDWSNAFFDFILPYLRNKYIWFPFYIFLFSFLIINFKRKGIHIILLLALTVGFADFTSSHLIKKTVKRLRPCKVLEQPADFNLLVGCGSGYSFPSSHAANHFAMAIALILVLGKKYKWVKFPLLFWASVIAFSQVYVGVHYPLDAVVGAILGSLIAFVFYFIFRKKIDVDLS